MLASLAWFTAVRVVPEIEFRSFRLRHRHIAQPRFRQRLEAMSPERVRQYLARTGDAAVVEYLQRLLPFCEEQEALRNAPTGERMSVTFVMGEDPNPENRFYTAAADFFRLDESARTEFVETSLRSLAEVRDWLERHRPANGLPWGVVNVVVHTYEWGGLAVPVRRGQGRTDALALRRAIEAGEMKPLPDSVVDCRTDVRIQGCALGRDSTLLELLSAALGGAGLQRPVVRSSRLFVFYESRRERGVSKTAEQFLADYWYVTYPKGRRPGNAELSRKLRDRYPDVAVNWSDALGRTNPRFIGDSYRRTYELPVTWLAVYPDSASRPFLEGTRERRQWLDGQAEFTSYLGRLGLETGDFLWTVRDTVVTESAGPRPALFALGRATIVAVLQEMTERDSVSGGTRRARAEPGDERYFCAIVPARAAAKPLGENVALRTSDAAW